MTFFKEESIITAIELITVFNLIAIGTLTGNINLWTTDTFKLKLKFFAHKSSLTSLKLWNPFKKELKYYKTNYFIDLHCIPYLISYGLDAEFKLWDLKDGKK